MVLKMYCLKIVINKSTEILTGGYFETFGSASAKKFSRNMSITIGKYIMYDTNSYIDSI